MAFIEAKCKNCGGDIRLDEKLNRGKCDYCGTEFVKSDIIVNKNYKIDNATLVLNEDSFTEQMFVNAETYLLKLKDYDKAFDTYHSITQSKADDCRGWWGMLRAASHDFTLIQNSRDLLEALRTYADNAIKLAADDEKESFIEQWDTYRRKLEGYIDGKEVEYAFQRVEQLEKERALKRNRRLRRIIVDVVSIAVPAFVILFGFFNFTSGVVEYGAPIWFFAAVGLGISAVVSIIAQLIASAPECFVAHTIATLLVVVYLCYRFLIDDMPRTSFSELLVLLFWGIVTAIIMIVPPFLVFRHLAHKKLGYK